MFLMQRGKERERENERDGERKTKGEREKISVVEVILFFYYLSFVVLAAFARVNFFCFSFLREVCRERLQHFLDQKMAKSYVCIFFRFQSLFYSCLLLQFFAILSFS